MTSFDGHLRGKWGGLRRLALGALALTVWTAAAWGQSADARRPVLVELFTSEGCSDCPPADKLLAELDATQFVPGAEAIVLSEHVTYWDSQGWRDPFSMEEATDRQQHYASLFGLNDVYTPQAVVDGAAQMVGSNANALARAVAEEAAKPRIALTLEGARWENGVAEFSVHATAPANARLYAALAADATHSEVTRGENAGRTLHHVAVVRVIKEFDPEAADGRPLQLKGGGLANMKDATGPVRLVVFLADKKSGHVLGVAEAKLAR